MKIFYLTPFATDLNIGREYNEQIEALPDDCYCVIRDGDTLFMRSDWGNQIEDIIRKHGDKYKLIGCMTNRLRANHQLFRGQFSNDGDISHHVDIANTLYDHFYDQVEPTTYVAGLCMIFHKSTWQQVKFRENSNLFDKEFNTDIRMKFGGRTPIGLAKGLYVFHLYRWGSKDPYNDINHLKM